MITPFVYTDTKLPHNTLITKLKSPSSTYTDNINVPDMRKIFSDRSRKKPATHIHAALSPIITVCVSNTSYMLPGHLRPASNQPKGFTAKVIPQMSWYSLPVEDTRPTKFTPTSKRQLMTTADQKYFFICSLQLFSFKPIAS